MSKKDPIQFTFYIIRTFIGHDGHLVAKGIVHPLQNPIKNIICGPE